jgi:DNA-binding CsgD family transcriptional regulator
VLCIGIRDTSSPAGADQRRGHSSHDFAPRTVGLAPPGGRLAPDAENVSKSLTAAASSGNPSLGRVRSAGVTSPASPVDLAAMVWAVHALASPLEWGSQDAWLAESLKRVREACGRGGSSGPDPTGELEELLRLDGDEPGWLQAALDSSATTPPGNALPPLTAAEDCLLVVSLRRALGSGLAMLHRIRGWRSTLGQVCDDLNAGMAIYRHDGIREMARNTRWHELMDEEPERDRLLELIRRRLENTGASVDSPREDYWELELSGRRYGLTAKHAPAGTLLPEAGVLVLMDCLSPELPTTRELRITFGLRGREPQVALLAAEGLSNPEIAQRLRLSAHTVRHYLERVLNRLGLHSRKALALHLMGGERQQQQQQPVRK